MRILLFFLLLFVLSSCSQKSPEYFQREARELKLQLIETLQKIENLDDMVMKSSELQALFEELAKLAIEARRYQLKAKIEWAMTAEDRKLNQELRFELNRLYSMEGVAELMERCQMPALTELDAFEKKTTK